MVDNFFINLDKTVSEPVGVNAINFKEKDTVQGFTTRSELKSDTLIGKPFYEQLDFSNIKDELSVCNQTNTVSTYTLEPKKEEPPFLDPLYLSLLKQDMINNEKLSCQFKK
jgi:hypothetical protein